MPSSRHITIGEACELLLLSRTTLWRHVTSGEIPAVRLGATIRMLREGLDEYVDGCRIPVDGETVRERSARAREREEARLGELRRQDRTRRKRPKETSTRFAP